MSSLYSSLNNSRVKKETKKKEKKSLEMFRVLYTMCVSLSRKEYAIIRIKALLQKRECAKGTKERKGPREDFGGGDFFEFLLSSSSKRASSFFEQKALLLGVALVLSRENWKSIPFIHSSNKSADREREREQIQSRSFVNNNTNASKTRDADKKEY